MSQYETYPVCKYCFNLTKTSNPPVLEESSYLGTCISCGGEWVGINIGYYNPDKKYYQVRRRQYNSENELCRLNIKDKCNQGEKCRYAHNRLELELWIEEEEKLLTEMKNVITNKIRCVICKIEFRDVPNLETHLQSRDHVTRTNGQYKGPIRARPKVPFSKDTYEMCRNFMRHGRCDFSTGCKYAHSKEELKVWKQAQMAEENSSRAKPPISSSYSSGIATDTSSHSRFKSQRRDIPNQIEGDSEYYRGVQGEIQFLTIEDVVKNRPKHIEILCNNHLEQIMDESPKEFKWVFRIKSSKQEILQGITLYEDRNVFKLEGVHKGVEGGKYCEIKFPYIPNRTCYQLQQEINSTTFIDVTLAFKPKIGQHQVYIVVECMDGGLVARKVNVKVKGVTCKDREKSMVRKANPVESSKTGNSIRPFEDVVPLQGYTEGTYQNKSNSLHRFVAICQQEITQVHDNTEIITAIHDQLTFAKIALENLEKQTFEVKKREKRENSLVQKTNPAESSRTRNSIRPSEDVVPLQNQTEETYQNKSNSLHRFVTICQQEITQVHDNTEIAAAINEQLTFVKISLGNLERQRYLEQQKTL